MKRVRINQGKVAMVTKRGDYQRLLNAGKHRLKWGETITQFEVGTLYTSNRTLDLCFSDEQFLAAIELIEIADGQIAVLEHRNVLDKVLTPGRYFYFKGMDGFKVTLVDLSKIYITEKFNKELFGKAKLLAYQRVYTVEPFEKGLLFVDGEYTKTLEKGVYRFWKNSQKVEVLKADLRLQAMEVIGQEILTRDKVALRVNCTTQYKIADVEKALLDNKDFEKQLYVLTQLALREYIGTLTLDQLLEDKNAAGDAVLKRLKNAAAKLGLEVVASGIKDIILPGDMKTIMNQVIMAEKKAQANAIARKEETAATRSLLNTAKLMEDNTMLFKLKEMEYLEKVAERVGEITISGNGKILDQLSTMFVK